MIAATPGISACFDIGDGAPGGWCGLCAETGATPPEAAALRSAVSATIAPVTPGTLRIASSACARAVSQARALRRLDIDRQHHLAVRDRDIRQHIGFGQRNAIG